MEPGLTAVVDKLKSLAKSGEDFISSLIQRQQNASRRNPIEILKRLQREAFSDLMKLRDRQDKVERALSFYRTSKGGPFQEDATRVKGEVDLLGALVLMGDLHSQNSDELCRAWIRTGIMSRITFETTVRQKDTAVMEFATSQQNPGYFDDVSGGALSIAKIGYTANVADWLSLVAIPIGGRCRDVAATTGYCQDKGLTDYSSYGPPLLSSQNGSAIGITVRKSNVHASLAQFDSGLGNQPSSIGLGHYLSTFGQIVCQFPKKTKLSLFGLHRVPKRRQPRNLGALAIPLPLGILKRRKPDDTAMEPAPHTEVSPESITTGSVAVMLESELDEDTRLQGWVQLKNSNPRCIQWAVGLSDSPEDEVGWGLSLGGMVQGGPAHPDHLQVEAFMKLNMGKRCTLQPGVVYVMDGTNRMPAIMCRASWCF